MPKLSLSKEIKNHPLFSNMVKLEYEQNFETIITSTGYSYLVLVYGDISINNKKENYTLPKVFINSIMPNFNIVAKKNSWFVVIRMNTDRFYQISKTNVNIQGAISKISHIVSQKVVDDLHREIETAAHIDYILIIDKHLKPFYAEWIKKSKISDIIDYIFINNGLLNVTNIIDEFHISHSSLNRYFKTATGVTANKFLRLIRFNYIVRHLEANNIDMLSAIEEFKYYDYSHFSRDVKQFSGKTPKQLFGTKHPILRDMLYKKIRY
ncbi:helix-turn-helix domain-containing protein [Gaetbulibacter sp. NE]|uniref:helix-turn-helix domain-containing protein n=1 Tax=Gaetbulibacter sp. NE TaxID=2982307 RepID=UPI0021D19675|nr:AraC family transcriptional regulator [Gaetbulibacter sp. NE]